MPSPRETKFAHNPRPKITAPGRRDATLSSCNNIRRLRQSLQSISRPQFVAIRQVSCHETGIVTAIGKHRDQTLDRGRKDSIRITPRVSERKGDPVSRNFGLYDWSEPQRSH